MATVTVQHLLTTAAKGRAQPISLTRACAPARRLLRMLGLIWSDVTKEHTQLTCCTTPHCTINPSSSTALRTVWTSDGPERAQKDWACTPDTAKNFSGPGNVKNERIQCRKGDLLPTTLRTSTQT